MNASILPFDRDKHPKSKASGRFVETTHDHPGTDVIGVTPIRSGLEPVTEDFGLDLDDWRQGTDAGDVQFGDNEATVEFPAGPMTSNVSTITGLPDFERLDSRGHIQPVLGYSVEEIAAADRVICDLVFNPDRRLPYAGIADGQVAAKLAETGCIPDVNLASFPDDVAAMHAAETGNDRAAYAAAIAELRAHQAAAGWLQRPVVDSAFMPPGDWVDPDEDHLYARSYGARYDETREPTVITANVRADIRAAQKAGWLPKGAKFSVRQDKYSMGWSLNVKVLNVSPLWVESVNSRGDQVRNRDAIELARRVTSIAEQFNHDGSDTMSEYSDVRYFTDVAWEFDADYYTRHRSR